MKDHSPPLSFEILSQDPKNGKARTGLMRLGHGTVPTPAFMPVGTLGTVKSLTPGQLRETGSAICLGNTYHLYLRPGMDIIESHGGLHNFMGWQGPILTDSGGYQVFSLSSLRKIDEDGVNFRSHIDGSHHRLTPEKSIEIQETLGSDIAMCFDECPPANAPREDLRKAMARTTAWAHRCKSAHTRKEQALFGIIQGGTDQKLRQEHAEAIGEIDFDGFAIDGLSVGESHEDLVATTRFTAALMPENKPRYLMGVGTPLDLCEAVAAGVDMFDCVMPTRNARQATAFTSEGKLNLRNRRFRDDLGPVDPQCKCLCCTNFTRSYIRHLIVAKEILASTLLTIHNLTFYQDLMRSLRKAIPEGRLDSIVSHHRALAAQKEQTKSS